MTALTTLMVSKDLLRIENLERTFFACSIISPITKCKLGYGRKKGVVNFSEGEGGGGI